MVIFIFLKNRNKTSLFEINLQWIIFLAEKKPRIEDKNEKMNEWAVTLLFNLNTPFSITRIRFVAENFDAHLLPMLFFTFSDKKRLGDFVYLKINMESHIFKQELYTVVYHSQIRIT